jgi:hypothetical protein
MGCGVMRDSVSRRWRSFSKKHVAQLEDHVFVNGTRVSLSGYSQLF